jgi:RNA polymerase sigma-70 factor (ECF subfamily)
MCFQSEASVQRVDHVALAYMDALYSYAFGLTRNRTDAEDLVQETYLRLMTAMNPLRAESNVKSWLFTVLRNTWINQLRKRRTAHEVDGVEIDQFRAWEGRDRSCANFFLRPSPQFSEGRGSEWLLTKN